GERQGQGAGRGSAGRAVGLAGGLALPAHGQWPGPGIDGQGDEVPQGRRPQLITGAEGDGPLGRGRADDATRDGGTEQDHPARKQGVGRITWVLAGLTVLVLLLSVPRSLRDAFDRGGFYLFSRAFLEDLPKRLVGPGRFRFVLQPLVATFLGIRGGLA